MAKKGKKRRDDDEDDDREVEAPKPKPRPAPRPVRPAAPKGPGEPVYTVMAAVTLLAMLVGCALLYLDHEDYGKQNVPTEKVPALPPLGGGDAKGTA
ncbi:MAG: hypothetical protein K2X82_12400 [Gemmataceae bacterium]|nr:hypothetical protein [Gemmataceae bacterium]